MKIGVLGTGDVGRALGKGFVTLGHDVKMGARDAANDKARAWAREMGPRASTGTFAEAAAFSDLVVLATLGVANENVLRAAGPATFRAKVVIDATNPLDFSAGMPPKAGNHGRRLGGRAGPAVAPRGPCRQGVQHRRQPAQVAGILRDFGWGVVDLGGISASRYLEAMCMVWVLHGARTNTWNHAFKLLRK